MAYKLVYSTRNYERSKTLQTYTSSKNSHILKQLFVNDNQVNIENGTYSYVPSSAYKRFVKKFNKK